MELQFIKIIKIDLEKVNLENYTSLGFTYPIKRNLRKGMLSYDFPDNITNYKITGKYLEKEFDIYLIYVPVSDYYSFLLLADLSRFQELVFSENIRQEITDFIISEFNSRTLNYNYYVKVQLP